MLSLDLFTEHRYVLAVVLFFTIYHVVTHLRYALAARKLNCKPLPDRTLAFWGIPLFFKALKLKKEGRMIDYSKERFDTTGLDTFKFRIAGMRLFTTRDPENIKAMLATQFNDFGLGARHDQLFPFLGDGIFTLDGNGWKHSRAMLRPQFAREQVAHLSSLEPHVQLLKKHIQNTKGGKFEIQELFFKLTVDSATEFLFGESVSSLADETVVNNYYELINFDGKKGFAEAFNTTQKYLSTRLLAQRLYWIFDSKKFRDYCARVHKFSDYYVQKALDASPQELEEKGKDGYIFLYELVKETRNRKVLRDQLLNILLAGRDTTASLLSFAFFEMARNQQIWKKLRKEIDENFLLGDNVDLDLITFESLKKCEYLKAIINETLRLYPSVPHNSRIATKDTSLPRGGGEDGQSPVFIPKGQTVTYAVSSMHRSKRYYGEDAEVFRPERWLSGETKKVGWAYLPFNGGPRICLGQQFALTEAGYVISRLAQIFPNLSSFDDEYPPRKSSHLTMCLQDGVNISLS